MWCINKDKNNNLTSKQDTIQSNSWSKAKDNLPENQLSAKTGRFNQLLILSVCLSLLRLSSTHKAAIVTVLTTYISASIWLSYKVVFIVTRFFDYCEDSCPMVVGPSIDQIDRSNAASRDRPGDLYLQNKMQETTQKQVI